MRNFLKKIAIKKKKVNVSYRRKGEMLNLYQYFHSVILVNSCILQDFIRHL